MCVLDPLLANQLITNASLNEAVMPRPIKQATVRPSSKKPSLDKDILSNYRPVSNLTQLSKVIKKVVTLRIVTHVSDQQMVACFQLAYRKNIRLKLRFSLYVQPIGDIIRAHGLFFHHYANDLQIYSHFDLNPSALAAVVQQMEDCLENIKKMDGVEFYGYE